MTPPGVGGGTAAGAAGGAGGGRGAGGGGGNGTAAAPSTVALAAAPGVLGGLATTPEGPGTSLLASMGQKLASSANFSPHLGQIFIECPASIARMPAHGSRADPADRMVPFPCPNCKEALRSWWLQSCS